MADNKSSTTVKIADEDILTLLAQPGAESIMTAAAADDKEDGKKPSLFSRKQIDLSFLDKPDPNKDKKNEEDPEAAKKAEDARIAAEEKKKKDIEAGILNSDGTTKSAETILKEIQDLNTDDDDDEKKTGRPKIDRDALVQLTQKLIDKKMITPFEGEEDISKYSLKDFEDLYEANDKEKQTRLEKEVPVKFFDQLPDEMKAAAAYIANGGTDLKGMFRVLADAQETASLDIETEAGQEAIIRQYLQSINFGDAEDIEKQLDEWKDQELLEPKATGFKPKLDALQEQHIRYKVAQQEKTRKQQQDQANQYMKNVYEVLEPGELNGIKMDKKIQSMLYSGLVQPNYPSISGKQTNLLGHLLEQHQWVKPNHGLIAEALWLLADPDGYKAKLKEGGKKDAVSETIKKLKTEEGKKIASTGGNEEEDENKNKKTAGIPRPGGGFFKR